jgi:hypothetical protein
VTEKIRGVHYVPIPSNSIQSLTIQKGMALLIAFPVSTGAARTLGVLAVFYYKIRRHTHAFPVSVAQQQHSNEAGQQKT